ncbi:hypothetical protein N9B88_01100 [Rubripirellula sp.]|nr:hypothetical protein [Rubripirellula sp.]
MMKRSLPAKWVPAQVALHFSFFRRNFQGARRRGDIWGPTDTGEKTESTDDEGSGDSNSDDSNSD